MRATTLRLLRVLRWAILILLILVLSMAGYVVLPVLNDPEDNFLTRKGELLESTQTRQFKRFADEFEEHTLQSDSGLQVEISVRRPTRQARPLPVVLLVGGYGTGRHAIELIQSQQDVVIASLNYPYTGDSDMDGPGLLLNIRDIQRAMLDISPAIMLTLDYLYKQEYVDPSQIELAGVSLGAFFVAIPGALDERFSRVWLVHGAGDPESIFAYRLQDSIESDWLRQRIAELISLLGNVHHLTPERWVGRISPRKVMAINARDDTAFPLATVEALHNAFKQPYEIIWIEGGHVKPSRPDIVNQLTEIMLSRVKQGGDN